MIVTLPKLKDYMSDEQWKELINDLWIKCSDRQPEKDGRYLVCEQWHSTGFWIGVASMRKGEWDSSAVKWWQDLPELPSEVKGE